MKLYNVAYSGNSYKVRLLLAQLGISHEIIEINILKGESRTAEFLKINPNGRTPVLDDNGFILAESNAILAYLAKGTKFLPEDRKKFARAFQWMFFEQYSHEPALAVLRYLKRFTPDPDAHQSRIAELVSKSTFALGVLEKRLAQAQWIAGPAPTIADYALYPYTHWMNEVGFSHDDWPAISLWMRRFEKLPRFLPLYTDAATEVIAFADYFATPQL